MNAYLLEIKRIEDEIVPNYPILDMEDGSEGDESGLDYIPELDKEEVIARSMAMDMGLDYEWLVSQRYSDFLIWSARYKAKHWRSPDKKSSNDRF